MSAVNLSKKSITKPTVTFDVGIFVRNPGDLPRSDQLKVHYDPQILPEAQKSRVDMSE